MKFITNRKRIQKIIVSIVTIVVLMFSVPVQSQAAKSEFFGSDLIEEIIHLVAGLGDIFMGAFNNMMLGTTKWHDSALLDQGDDNLTTQGSSVYYENIDIDMPDIQADELDGLRMGKYMENS